MVASVIALTTLASTQQGATIAGRISHADGTPAAEAPVFAATVERGGRLREVARTRSEWDGQYRLRGVLPGRYVIGASLNEKAPATYYPGAHLADPWRSVTVVERVPVEGIDIWLGPFARRYTVSGRVYWPDGHQIDNLSIEYGAPANPHMGIWYVFDPGGLFTIEGAPGGAMVLLARADTATGPLIGMSSTDVAGHVEDVRIDLERPGTLAGRVVFDGPRPPGELRVRLVHALLRVSPLYPVEDAAISANGQFHVASARGQYSFVVTGLPDTWRIRRVRHHGRALPSDRATVGAAEQTSGVELQVGPE